MKRHLIVSVAPLLLLMTACGGDGVSTSARSDDAIRTVQITMRDIAYEPTTLEVEAGETVRFVFTNAGAADHDAFIGDVAAQADHEAEMRAAGDGGHGAGHGRPDSEGAITVAPGDTGEITHTFDAAGETEIGCHQPGHYDAGMKINVTVA